MTLRFPAATAAFVAVLGLAGFAAAQDKTDAPAAQDKADSKAADPGKGAGTKSKKAKIEKATFGAGCFWSTEAVFERVHGVKSVVSGFSGGSVPNPSYEMVCTGMTGHAEVVQIEFDPSVVTYEALLKVFWKSHDPTTPNAQGDDFGPQYRSVILYHDEAQKKAAEKVYKELTARRVYRDPIVTELVPYTKFFPAEPYHQNYFRMNRDSEYSQIYIIPKLRKLKLK